MSLTAIHYASGLGPIATRRNCAMTPGLQIHQVCLESQRLRLRPMTEDDWGTVLRWNQDPEILFYSEGADVVSY